jgi:hypothetical protein
MDNFEYFTRARLRPLQSDRRTWGARNAMIELSNSQGAKALLLLDREELEQLGREIVKATDMRLVLA